MPVPPALYALSTTDFLNYKVHCPSRTVLQQAISSSVCTAGLTLHIYCLKSLNMPQGSQAIYMMLCSCFIEYLQQYTCACCTLQQQPPLVSRIRTVIETQQARVSTDKSTCTLALKSCRYGNNRAASLSSMFASATDTTVLSARNFYITDV